MKKPLAAALVAMAVVLALPSPAAAFPTSPADTPALACSRGTVDLAHPPVDLPVDQLYEVARRLGMTETPDHAGYGCDQAIRVYPDAPVHDYPGHGPVVLRSNEKSPSQVYCTNSVSAVGLLDPVTPVRIVIGAGCVVETNPFVID
ncbi:hypothetical protein [Kitasatospora sp. NPDC056184]|uniref:hypothetical protein n=1 Tax=Kitasatospora sp. NPDC056184 TaxID=3345738 RepID=UPI0035DF5A85